MSNRARFIFYLALTLIVIGVKFLDIEELDQFELRFQDMVYDFKQAGEPSEDVVIVTIDKLSLEQIGSWPWPEETIADLVAAIGTADPRTTMIDFPIPVMDHRGASDTAKAGALMAQQLKLMNNVTLVYDIVPSERASDTVINPKYLFRNALVTNTDLGVLSEEQAIPVKAVALPDEKLADAAARLGFNYTQTDPDMVLRSDPLIMNFDGYYYPSAPLAAAGHYLRWQPENLLIYGGKSIKAPDREIPTDRHGRMLLNYPVGGGFNLISATDVLHQRVDFAEFKNKLVMVALATGSQMEYYRSPVTNETPSYIKSAVAIDNIISKEYLMRADSALGWYVLALFFIGVIFAFGLPLISSLYRVIVVALGLIVLANVNYFMFNSFNMLANSIYVALLLILFLVASPLTTLDYSFLTALFRRKSEEEGDNGEVEGAKAKSRARRQPGADDGEEWTRMPAGQSANATANETMNATVALTSAVQAQSDLSQTNATAALGESAGNAGTPAFKHSESARKVHKHDITGQGAIVDPPAPPPASTADPDKTAVGMGAEGFGDISGADLDTPLVDKPAIEETSAISPDEVNIPSVEQDSTSIIESAAQPSRTAEEPSQDTPPPQDAGATQIAGDEEQSDSQKMREILKESAPAMQNLPDGLSRLGRYELQGVVGKGAMGLVYRGVDPAINRSVALKTIRLDFLTEEEEIEEMKERLFLEAQAAGMLNHPNIVTIYDVGSEGTTQYIAMEFLEGQTLESMIKRKVNFNFKIVANIIYQICSALQYAHDQNIVHRDIKPANIMVLPDFSIKVMDFGIARVESSGMTKTGVAMGTPNYISPEQLQGKKIDGRSDLFSLGVVFYEMLLGQRPFSGENLTSLMYSIMNSQPETPSKLNSRVPPLFDMIINKALQKTPGQRYQKASDMAAALSDFVKSF